MASPVLFDLDETLFNRSASVRAFVTQQFSGRDLGRFVTLNAACDRFMVLDARGSVPKTVVYQTLTQEMGGGNDWQALFDDYEANAWRHATGFEGMRELLVSLRKQGRKLGIVSNGQTHIQLRSLLALGLDRLVDCYLISETEGCRKPEPEIFRRAASRLGAEPRDCIFVGDSPQADMAGARAVQMRTVWFPNGLAWPVDFDWQPDAVVTSLAEVGEAIEKLDGMR